MAIATLIERKPFGNPEETRTFPHGRMDIVTIAGQPVGLARFEPGWKWSTDMRPIVGTHTCQSTHFGFVLSGKIHIVMDDGTSVEYGPGDAMSVPPGHDAWVVGDQTCIIFDTTSAPTYAKSK